MTSVEKNSCCSGGFQAYCRGVRDLVDSELQSLLPVIAEMKLRKQIEYALHTKGKRLRATLVLLSGESLGGDREQLRRLGLSVEMMHLATLIHDDILDEDLFRRNALSVYARWSIKDAVLVGDMLASLSLSMCKGYRREILEVMIDACMELSDGEYSDVESVELNLNEKQYFEKIKKKCASLFRAAGECGALAANGSDSEINALRGYGENYGLAYQIRDDISDAEASGGDVQPDANKFRTTLPIIHVLESAGKEQQRRLEKLLSQKTPESLSAFLAEVKGDLENGSISYCAGEVDKYVDRAVASLGPLKESAFKGCLFEMANSLRTKQPEFLLGDAVMTE